ncbi:MAG: polymorphic toxin-type HINT domain-containing protein, partial [Aureliella sp.]
MAERDWKQAASNCRWLGLIAAVAIVWAAGRWAAAPQHGPPTSVKPITSRGAQALTRPIESIRVGERVLARNPELSDAERTAEPNWTQWVHVSLQLPLAAATDHAQPAPARSMKIELLRPEAWLLERMGYVAQLQDEPALARADDLPGAESDSSIPVREIFQETARIAQWLREQNIELLGRCIDLELVEMGAVGQAMITEIRPCPPIASGDGQVVTATFEHPPSTQVLEVRFGEDEAESPALGVTENHPFWSVDAQRFVPIGQLEVGQRVVTYQGEVKRIASKLPRSAPEKVYNLEVYGEHVYFVGEEGLLAHNNCAIGDLGEKGAKQWLKRHGYTEVMQIQNQSGHGIDIVARHRDGTLTF